MTLYESSRLEFLQKFSTSNFSLSDIEDNTSGSLNKGATAYSALLGTQSAICQKSLEPSSCELIDSFLLLLP